MKSLKNFFGFAAAVVLLMVFAAALPGIVEKIFGKTANKTVIDHVFIEEKLQEVGELAVMRHTYSNPGAEFEDTWLFSTKKFKIAYEGTIKIGFDLDKVRAEVDNEHKHIVIHYPEPEIISHEINMDKIVILKQKNGWWNRINPGDAFKLVKANKDLYAAQEIHENKAKSVERFKRITVSELNKFFKVELGEGAFRDKPSIGSIFGSDVYTIEFVPLDAASGKIYCGDNGSFSRISRKIEYDAAV